MNLSDHGNPFPVAPSGSTPPASPAKASSSTPSSGVRYSKLKKLSLGGGVGIGGPDIEADVKDAMQDSPILMKQQATSPYSHHDRNPESATTSLIALSPLSDQQSTDSTSKRSSTGAISSIPSNPSSPTRPRSQRAKGWPLSLQYRPYALDASPFSNSSSGSGPQFVSAEINQKRRSRTPQFHRARRKSTERSDSLGSVRSPTTPEGDESVIGSQTDPLFEEKARKHMSLGSLRSSNKDNLQIGMGMGPRRSAPLTLVEQHAILLSTIAKKEAQVNETRQELKAQETELAILKAEWESIVSRSAMISTTSPNSKDILDRSADEGLPSSEIPGAATATAALEGGKKLLGQLMGSISLGASGTSASSQDLQFSKDAVKSALMANNEHGRRSNSNTRIDRNQLDHNDSRSKGFSEQPGRNPRRPSFASDTASERASRSTSSATTRSRPQDDALAGLGLGQVLEGMVDPGEWTRRWGEVMSNPQVQAGSKRASIFLSASLADTYSLLTQALPTPNLAALNPPSMPSRGETVARSGRQDGIKKVPPAPSNRRRLTESSTFRDTKAEDVREADAVNQDDDSSWDW